MNQNIVNTAYNILHSSYILDDFESIEVRFENVGLYISFNEPPVNAIFLDFTIKSGVYVNCFELANNLSKEFNVRSVNKYVGKFTIEFGV